MDVSERMLIILWREWGLIECLFRVSLIGWETFYKLLIILDEEVRSSLFKVNRQNLRYFIVENKPNRTLFSPKFSETEHFLRRPLRNDSLRAHLLRHGICHKFKMATKPALKYVTNNEKSRKECLLVLLVTALSIIGCVLFLLKATKQFSYPWHFFKTVNWFETELSLAIIQSSTWHNILFDG